MIAEISEFSYGFALTNEIVGWQELFAAPIFPSLIEEGRAGGGYDVKLDRPGTPLFLQFKRSEYMTRRSAREYREVQDQSGQLLTPFYRFPITETAKSDQHELLLALDVAPNHVFYAAPRFHKLSEINEAWHASAVTGRSVFVAPSEIGTLDYGRHTVAFDRANSWICSEPRSIRVLNSRELVDKLHNTLRGDAPPLRERLSTLVGELRDAERRGFARVLEKLNQAARDAEARKAAVAGTSRDEQVIESVRHTLSTLPDQAGIDTPEPTPPPIRTPKPLEPALLSLREASDLAARVFDAQLIIVQPLE